MVLDEREVKDDNIDQYIRDILELIKSQMPNGFYQNLPDLQNVTLIRIARPGDPTSGPI